MKIKQFMVIILMLIIITTGCKSKSQSSISKEKKEAIYLEEIDYNQYHSLLEQNKTFIMEVIEDDNFGCSNFHKKLEKIAQDYNLEIKYINIDHLSDDIKEKFKEEMNIYDYFPITHLFKNGIESIETNIYGDTLSTLVIKTLSEEGFISQSIPQELYIMYLDDVPFTQLRMEYYTYEVSEYVPGNPPLSPGSITFVLMNDTTLNSIYSKYGNCAYYSSISTIGAMSDISSVKCIFSIDNDNITITLDTAAGKSTIDGIIKDNGKVISLTIGDMTYDLESEYYKLGKENGINKVLYDTVYQQLYDLEGYDFKIPRDVQERLDITKYDLIKKDLEDK